MRSLRPVAAKLADLINRPVAFVDDCIGEKVEKTAGALKEGDILLLENTRYYDQEEANDPAFSEQLAKVADLYVNDAFGAAHRAHASTSGMVAHVRQKCAGFLMADEVDALTKLLAQPRAGFVAVLGGAKVSDKIAVLEKMLAKVDALMIGGAMAYTFLAAQGRRTGASRLEQPHIRTAQEILAARDADRR